MSCSSPFDIREQYLLDWDTTLFFVFENGDEPKELSSAPNYSSLDQQLQAYRFSLWIQPTYKCTRARKVSRIYSPSNKISEGELWTSWGTVRQSRAFPPPLSMAIPYVAVFKIEHRRAPVLHQRFTILIVPDPYSYCKKSIEIPTPSSVSNKSPFGATQFR